MLTSCIIDLLEYVSEYELPPNRSKVFEFTFPRQVGSTTAIVEFIKNYPDEATVFTFKADPAREMSKNSGRKVYSIGSNVKGLNLGHMVIFDNCDRYKARLIIEQHPEIDVAVLIKTTDIALGDHDD